MGKVVTIILVILVAVLLLTCAILAYFVHASTRGRNVCTTERCLADASRIKGLLNTSVDPCVDFYQFSCGNFKMTPFDGGTSMAHTFSRLGFAVMEQVRGLLELPMDYVSVNNTAVRKMKMYYRSCVEPYSSEGKHLFYLKEMVRGVGGFPDTQDMPTEELDLTQFTPGSFDFDQALQYVHMNLSTSAFLKMDVDIVPNESGDGLVSYLRVGGGFTRMSCQAKSVKTLAKNLALCFSPKKKVSVFADDVSAVYDYLCQKTDIPDDYRPVPWFMLGQTKEQNNTFLTWSKFLDEEDGIKLSKIDWYSLFENPYRQWNRQKVKFFESGVWNMMTLVELQEKMEPRKLRNYLIFDFLITHMDAMPGCLRDAKGEGRKEDWENFRDPSQPKWKWCLKKAVNKAFSWAVLATVENEMDPPMTKDKQLYTMLEEVRQAVIRRTLALPWLSDRLKRVVERRITEKLVMIGGPKRTTDEHYLNNFYEHLSIHDDKPFLANFLNARMFMRQAEAVALRQPNIDYYLFIKSSDALFVNAFNEVSHGGMAIFWPLSQEPFYNHDSQEYLNYGGVGSIMGHEFGHDFDGYHTVNYWANKTEITEVVEGAECMLRFYNGLDVPGWNPGNDTSFAEVLYSGNTRTQTQGMSDITGNQWAFEAYRKHVADQGFEADPLPGLPYTQEQLFYIAHAQTWCGIRFPFAGPVRVMGGAAQDPYFSEVFMCPVGSPMNPGNDRCEIW